MSNMSHMALRKIANASYTLGAAGRQLADVVRANPGAFDLGSVAGAALPAIQKHLNSNKYKNQAPAYPQKNYNNSQRFDNLKSDDLSDGRAYNKLPMAYPGSSGQPSAPSGMRGNQYASSGFGDAMKRRKDQYSEFGINA